MLSDTFGLPQVAAALILFQRALEELHAQRNTRRLFEQGAHEEGREYFSVVATAHLSWVASLALLIPGSAQVYMFLLILFLALQPLRYWIIATLGCYWTHRIVTLPSAPIVTKGPYRYLRHPNYVLTLAETFLLPVAFGQIALGVIFTAIWGAVLHYKILLEDRAISIRRETAVARS
jgi:methyltransferase